MVLRHVRVFRGNLARVRHGAGILIILVAERFDETLEKITLTGAIDGHTSGCEKRGNGDLHREWSK